MRNLFWILFGVVVTGFLLVVAWACGPMQGWAMTFLVVAFGFVWWRLSKFEKLIEFLDRWVR